MTRPNVDWSDATTAALFSVDQLATRMAKVDFYALPGCPYSALVERTLEELDVTYEKHEVPPDHADRSQVRHLTGRTHVPVIVDKAHGIEAMDDRSRIVAHLRETYG